MHAGATAAIPELDRRGLRRFALVTGGMVAALFGLLMPLLLRHPWPIWPWVLFGVLAALGMTVPAALRPVYRAWMRFGLAMGRITTPLILALVFFLVISPLGLLRRLFLRDSIARGFDRCAASYRVSSHSREAKSLERPF